jgi:hypothetical protein
MVDNFRAEVAKVRNHLLPDAGAANTILNSTERLTFFFMAVLALIALHCQGSPAIAKEAFGLKRSFLSGWKV